MLSGKHYFFCMNEIKATRINIGLYRFTVNNRIFEAEDIARCKRENGDSTSMVPDWNLYEIINGSREWWNDFATLGDCKRAAQRTTAKELPDARLTLAGCGDESEDRGF